MIASVAKRLALVAVLLAGLWAFIPYELPPYSVSYHAKGIWFDISEHWRVRSITILRRRRNRERLKPPADARRPGNDEILPGVGCCGVMLGDTKDAVLAARGKARERSRGVSIIGYEDANGQRRRQVSKTLTLYYADVEVHLVENTVTLIVVTRESARTPAGLGIGSHNDEILDAYGPEWADRVKAFGTPEDEVRRWEKEDKRYRIGFGWLRKACIAGLVALLASVVSCLSLSALSQRPSWGLFVLAHFFLWSLVSTAVLLNWRFFWTIPYGQEDPAALDFVVCSWFKVPVLAALFLAAFLGLFLAGRLAARRLRRWSVMVYSSAVLGAALLGTIAGVFAIILGRAADKTLRYAEPSELWEFLFSGATIPSVVLALCFLLVACQTKRWWQTLRLTVGLEGTAGPEEPPWLADGSPAPTAPPDLGPDPLAPGPDAPK